MLFDWRTGADVPLLHIDLWDLKVRDIIMRLDLVIMPCPAAWVRWLGMGNQSPCLMPSLRRMPVAAVYASGGKLAVMLFVLLTSWVILLSRVQPGDLPSVAHL